MLINKRPPVPDNTSIDPFFRKKVTLKRPVYLYYLTNRNRYLIKDSNVAQNAFPSYNLRGLKQANAPDQLSDPGLYGVSMSGIQG
jgi:hypothetical protein